MNSGPQPATTPLELLENNDIFAPSFLSKWYNPVAGAALGLVSSLIANFATKKPVMSGLYSLFLNYIILFPPEYLNLLIKYELFKVFKDMY